MSVTNRVAIVTGGTSGLGEEIANFLSRAGARVVVAGRDAERGEGVAERLRGEGGEATFVHHDLRDREAAPKLLEATEAAFGGPDILVANAGRFYFGSFHEVSAEEFDDSIDVNLRGTFELVQQVIPGMVDRQFGRVIFMSSPAADFAVPDCSLYSMTKSAINGLMRALVPEYGVNNISFNAIQPGLTPTRMNETMLATPELREHYASVSPNKRLGTPADTAHVALMLADELAGHVTGMSIVIDGGQTRTQHHTALAPASDLV